MGSASITFREITAEQNRKISAASENFLVAANIGAGAVQHLADMAHIVDDKATIHDCGFYPEGRILKAAVERVGHSLSGKTGRTKGDRGRSSYKRVSHNHVLRRVFTEIARRRIDLSHAPPGFLDYPNMSAVIPAYQPSDSL